MERDVFTLREVQEVLKDFVVAKVVTDIGDAAANAVWAKYKLSASAGIPHYVVLDHDGEVLRRSGATLPGSTKAHEFVAFLKGDVAGVNPDNTRPLTPGVKPDTWPEGLAAPMPAELRDVFDFEARFTADKVRPGGEVTLELRFKLKNSDSGPYNLYHPSSPHAVAMDDTLFDLAFVSQGGLAPVGEWNFPDPYVLKPGTPKAVWPQEEWKFLGDFVATHRFKVPAGAAGPITVSGTLAGQYCDPRVCIWFTNMERDPFGWTATLTAAPDGVLEAIVQPSMDTSGASKPAPTAETETEKGSGGELSKRLEEAGLILFLLGIFGLGMVTLLTPCVLPVLPLTISFFVKQAEQGRSPFVAATIYCGCIIATFTGFGLLTSLLLGASGAQIVATNGFVNIGIGILFLLLALSFFGAFELRVPSFVSSWLSRKQMKTQKEGRGYMTALLSGGSFSIISFSCTGPIAAAILAGAAGAGGGGEGADGRWLPLLAMLAFSAGLALPIFVVGQFPSLMKKLPKSGGWMNALKVVFAFVEVAIAVRYFAWADIYFSEGIYPAWFTRELVDAVWIACAFGAALYLLGVFRMVHDHEKTEVLGTTRTLIAVSFIAFGVWMLPGLVQGKQMGLIDGFLPPRQVVQLPGGAAAVKLEFTDDLNAALAQSKASGKPVFIDFTGEICANCRWVETNIFTQAVVSDRLASDFILVHQWTDRRGDAGAEARANYRKYGEGGGAGVPMYVIVDGDGKIIEKFVPPQFINSVTAKDFAEFLDRGKAKASK